MTFHLDMFPPAYHSSTLQQSAQQRHAQYQFTYSHGPLRTGFKLWSHTMMQHNVLALAFFFFTFQLEWWLWYCVITHLLLTHTIGQSSE